MENDGVFGWKLTTNHWPDPPGSANSPESPTRLDVAWVRAALPGRRVEWFSSLESTMTAAAGMVRDGAPAQTIVGADEQTAGVGRHGHSWHSERGKGLYVSFLVGPPKAANGLPLVMLALGLATRDAIAQVSGLIPDLRWPNDVLVDGKKCAGILALAEAGSLIAGIGVNVHQRDFPPDVADVATSLSLAGVEVAREALLVALAQHVDEYHELLASRGGGAVLSRFSSASSYVSGRRVRVDMGSESIEGVTRGLNPLGFLIVRQDNGEDVTILAGGVRPA